MVFRRALQCAVRKACLRLGPLLLEAGRRRNDRSLRAEWRRRACGHWRQIYPQDAVRLSLHLCRSEEHTSELQSLMRISYAVFCLKKKNSQLTNTVVQQ